MNDQPLQPLPDFKLGYYRHFKSGHVYKASHIGRLEKNLEPHVIYISEVGEIWIRPYSEFMDGRFVFL